MEKNVGETDQMIRYLLGAVLGAVSLLILAQSLDLVSTLVSLPELASPVFGVLALILLYTGYTRECPVCAAAGVDTTE